MTLPNFIIFGAIKSGTGALYQYLERHPQIYCCPLKEPRYFSSDDSKSSTGNKIRGMSSITSLDKYEKLFSGVKDEKAIGEASSNYINSFSAANRIKMLLPRVKLIASLRSPVDRAYAHYQMSSAKKTLTERNIQSFRNEEWAVTSLYFEKLKKYYELFNRDQIKILIFEKWVDNIPDTLAGLYKFLDVDDSYKIPPNIKYQPAQVRWPGIRRGSIFRSLKNYVPRGLVSIIHSTKIGRRQQGINVGLDAAVREAMLDWYREDVAQLESLVQMDLKEWLV